MNTTPTKIEVPARTLRPGDRTGTTPGHWEVIEPATTPNPHGYVWIRVRYIGDGALEYMNLQHDQTVRIELER
jgi:hypothetical protein